MRSHFLDRLRRRLAAEDGIALVMGLGVSMVLAIAGTSAVQFSTANQQSAVQSSASTGAFALAEAGLSSATSVLNNPNNNAMDPTLLPQRTTTYVEGSVTWSGVFDGATSMWTLRSTGTVRSGSATPAARTVTERVKVTASLTQPLVNRAWDYLYTSRVGGTCDVTLSASVIESSPLYVSGKLCLSAGSAITGGPLVVKSTVTLNAVDATIGSLAAPIPAAHLGGQCKYYTGVWHSPCTTADKVFATTVDSTIPVLTPPVPAWDSWYRSAAPGPYQGCATSSGTPPVFENETTGATRNNSVLTSFSLTPLASYTCRVGPADEPVGELSWDVATRTLTVNGTVFIDGSAKVDNGLLNLYKGQGTLYLSGSLFFSASSKLCAKLAALDCDFTGWDPGSPSSSLLTVVANGNGGQVLSGDSVQLSSSASFEGAIYATNAVQLGSSAQTKGPMITATVIFGGGSKAYSFPSLLNAPTGTPGTQLSHATVSPPQDFTG